MKSEQILGALTYIDEEYIQSAMRQLGYLQQEDGEERADNGHESGSLQISSGISVMFSIMKKVAVFISVTILALSTTVATAMVINEDFRETMKEIIFEFLHIEQEVVVPELSMEEEITLDNMYVEQERNMIGGVLEGRFVHAPVSGYAREGVYVICTDEVEMNQGSYYDAYYEENGEFIKLEEHTFCGDYVVLGNDFHIEFDWVVHNGQVVLTHVGAGENYRIPANPGDADACLVELIYISTTEEGKYSEALYPVLLNLETGELMDVLAGTGAERLRNLANQAISEDGSKMLLAQSEGDMYYVDLLTRTLYSVEELSGEKAGACSLIGNTLTCWVLEEEMYRAWAIDLTTMERRELFSGVPAMVANEQENAGIVYLRGFDTVVHWGTMFTGSYFALEVAADKTVQVIDMFTGEKIPVEGFVWPGEKYADILWDYSPDGKRLLISGGNIGSKYEYIGVLDFEKMSYLEFNRENANEVYEWTPYWFDKDTVIIPATAKDGSYYVQDYYIYDILDEAVAVYDSDISKNEQKSE